MFLHRNPTPCTWTLQRNSTQFYASHAPFRPYSSEMDPIKEAVKKVKELLMRLAKEAAAWASAPPKKQASGLSSIAYELQWVAPWYPCFNRANRSAMTAGTTPIVDPKPIANKAIKRAIWGGPRSWENCTMKDLRRSRKM